MAKHGGIVHRLLRALAFVMILGSGAAAAAQPVYYTVEELPSLNGPVTEAYDVSSDGKAIGRALDSALVAKAVLWPGMGVTTLGGTAAASAEARGIAPNGLIAGSQGDRAALWIDRTPILLDPLADHIASRGWDVNSSAVVVGWSVNSVGDPTAAMWVNGAITPLDVNHSWAFRSNDAGQIVGRRDVASGREARLWHKGSGATLVGLGANSASATNITPRGIITGGACEPFTPTACAPREVFWHGPNHTIQVLPMYPNALMENVWAANDRGLFVGEYSFSLSGSPLRGVIWRWPNLQPLDLSSLVAPGGWTIESAQAVNHRGEIVGFGTHPSLSGRRAVLLRPINFADITHDAQVNVADLLAVINAWGPCAEATPCPTDLNGDGVTNVNDLLIVINQWG